MLQRKENWISASRKKIYAKEKLEKKTVEPYDRDFLTVAEVAARAGTTKRSLQRWLDEGTVPSPKTSKRGPKVFRFTPNKYHHCFSRQFAEALRDCVIIRNSSTSYRRKEVFGKLCRKMLIRCL